MVQNTTKVNVVQYYEITCARFIVTKMINVEQVSKVIPLE